MFEKTENLKKIVNESTIHVLKKFAKEIQFKIEIHFLYLLGLNAFWKFHLELCHALI